MRATNVLPSNYHHLKTLNLSTPRIALGLNLAALPLLFFYGWIFARLLVYLRNLSPFPKGVLTFLTTFSGWDLIALPLSIIFMLVIHELIHGIFFWLFTHERPRFALKAGYAFAAAPEWYLPGLQYVLVGISPFVLISIVSLLLSLVTASTLVPYLLIVSTFNAAGSLGDIIVVAWVLKQPDATLIKDEGDVFSSFVPSSE